MKQVKANICEYGYNRHTCELVNVVQEYKVQENIKVGVLPTKKAKVHVSNGHHDQAHYANLRSVQISLLTVGKAEDGKPKVL